ncbi:hypothetical protein ETB97_008916 [Aspergillus alliaceus]|uniref:Flavin reductase like domain-containing protein n=1 Tax=Petromyces alliaceus TaxID=209559 RepID=A0A8H6A8U7_PETAA|nr:hypothetical protein ETB97_008916 [Aspergillus burnettii]
MVFLMTPSSYIQRSPVICRAIESIHADMDSAVGLRIPRPIGWISTKNKKGQCNLAPYSRFNNLTFDPPYVMFSSNQTATGDRKDMVVNAEEIGTFAWNLATWDVREAVNIAGEQTPARTNSSCATSPRNGQLSSKSRW